MRLPLTAAVVGLLLVGVVLAQDDDPFVGIWKLNVAKSQLTTPLRSARMTLQVGIDEAEFNRSIEKMDLEVEDMQGVRQAISYSARYSGPGDFEILDTATRAPTGEEAALRVIDAHTREYTRMRNKKALAISRRVLSADGKTITATTKSTTPDGKEIQEIQIWERQ